jgi:uncharacterized membrane protein
MKQRIHSIDIVRGLIMIIMTLDHARDFFHFPGQPPLNMQTTTGILFFTRWITHFCAPCFVFLSGISAFLAGRQRTKNELSSFLFKRGLWLILSDLLIISLLFSFDLQYHTFILEVLWAIGFGMIVLALLIRTSLPVIAAVGVIILFGHNILDYVQLPKTGFGASLLSFFVSSPVSVMRISTDRVVFEIYAALPWAGVLLLGYVFGRLYQPGFTAARRQRFLLVSGICFTVLFILLRAVNMYGDPSPWTAQRNAVHTILSFLNTTKQVPSLLFLSMTLGPVLVLLSLAEKMGNRFTEVCRVYGNVPYFYFIVHFTLLRLINILFILIEGIPMQSSGSPLVWQAQGFGHPLWTVYLIWIAVVVLLYYPCRWYGNYKRTHGYWWLSYI